jgi:hypothetical protein
MPIRNRRVGAVSFGHFGGVRLNLIAALSAPHDQANLGSRRAPECHRRAGFGFHLTASAVSSATRRLVASRLGERFAFRFGADHVADFSQHPNPGRQEVAIIHYDRRKLPFEKGGLFVGMGMMMGLLQ